MIYRFQSRSITIYYASNKYIPQKMFQKVASQSLCSAGYSVRSVTSQWHDIIGKIPYKAMTNENKIIYTVYLDRETMQGNVK